MWDHEIGDRVRWGRFVGMVVGQTSAMTHGGPLRLGYRLAMPVVICPDDPGGGVREAWEIDVPAEQVTAHRPQPMTA